MKACVYAMCAQMFLEVIIQTPNSCQLSKLEKFPPRALVLHTPVYTVVFSDGLYIHRSQKIASMFLNSGCAKSSSQFACIGVATARDEGEIRQLQEYKSFQVFPFIGSPFCSKHVRIEVQVGAFQIQGLVMNMPMQV